MLKKIKKKLKMIGNTDDIKYLNSRLELEVLHVSNFRYFNLQLS